MVPHRVLRWKNQNIQDLMLVLDEGPSRASFLDLPATQSKTPSSSVRYRSVLLGTRSGFGGCRATHPPLGPRHVRSVDALRQAFAHALFVESIDAPPLALRLGPLLQVVDVVPDVSPELERRRSLSAQSPISQRARGDVQERGGLIDR